MTAPVQPAWLDEMTARYGTPQVSRDETAGEWTWPRTRVVIDTDPERDNNDLFVSHQSLPQPHDPEEVEAFLRRDPDDATMRTLLVLVGALDAVPAVTA